MIRFRNPGSSTSTQIQILKALYHKFKLDSFSLTEMAQVLTTANLMTSHGYTGKEAIKLSIKKQKSLISPEMNVKMFAEIFKSLGWLYSVDKNESYPVAITLFGVHVATAESTILILTESILGIVYPNELFSKTSFYEESRFFLFTARLINDLGFIYKHELSYGSMSTNDDAESYNKTLTMLKEFRKNFSNEDYKSYFKKFSNDLKMQKNSVDNCTRFPVAKLKDCDIVSPCKEILYGKKRNCLKLTKYGKQVVEKFSAMCDIRKKDFDSYSFDIQNSLIRIAMWRSLSRAGFDISPVHSQLNKDLNKCSNILNGKDLLFSPCQILRYHRVQEALGDYSQVSCCNDNDNDNDVSILINDIRKEKNLTSKISYTEADISYFNLDQEIKSFVALVNSYRESGIKASEIIANIYKEHRLDSKDSYYPFIAMLFRVMGVNCYCSREGDNASRWDAVIKDKDNSIPIEIKSPTEETHVSVKAIRQALENKIILLSRKTFNTTPNSSSFVVGYNIPNERSEVDFLVKSFKDVFNVKIAVISLKFLLKIAVEIVLGYGGAISEKDFINMEGVYDVDI